jgi:hypothetical protein
VAYFINIDADAGWALWVNQIMKLERSMSEKERQKKDGKDTNKKNQAMRERTEQSSEAKKERDRPATYGQGLPRNDQPDSK